MALRIECNPLSFRKSVRPPHIKIHERLGLKWNRVFCQKYFNIAIIYWSYFLMCSNSEVIILLWQSIKFRNQTSLSIWNKSTTKCYTQDPDTFLKYTNAKGEKKTLIFLWELNMKKLFNLCRYSCNKGWKIKIMG